MLCVVVLPSLINSTHINTPCDQIHVGEITQERRLNCNSRSPLCGFCQYACPTDVIYMSGRLHRVEWSFLLSFSPLFVSGYCFFSIVISCRGDYTSEYIFSNSRSPFMNRFLMTFLSLIFNHFFMRICGS